MAGPRGIGIYFLKLPTETPKALARKLSDHGVTWAGICGPWHDARQTKRINRPDAVARYGDALSAKDIEPHLWGYPWHDRVDRFVDDMTACSAATTAGWLLDPELGLRKKPLALRSLIAKSRAALPRGPLGLTSYGSTAISFPWREVRGVDYGSPQLYTVGAPAVHRGLAAWSALGAPEIAPSFGLYTKSGGANRKKTPAELDAHFASFIDPAVPVRALIGWSYRWISPGHWKVIAKWAERMETGALVPF